MRKSVKKCYFWPFWAPKWPFLGVWGPHFGVWGPILGVRTPILGFWDPILGSWGSFWGSGDPVWGFLGGHKLPKVLFWWKTWFLEKPDFSCSKVVQKGVKRARLIQSNPLGGPKARKSEKSQKCQKWPFLGFSRGYPLGTQNGQNPDFGRFSETSLWVNKGEKRPFGAQKAV